MQPYTRKRRESNIREYKGSVAFRDYVLQVIERFKHFKKIDKRFFDEVRKFNDWTSASRTAGRINFATRFEAFGETVYIRLYMDDRDYKGLSEWGALRAELLRPQWEKFIQDEERALLNYDKDLLELKGLHEYLGKMTGEVIDIKHLKYLISQALNHLVNNT